MIGTRSLELQYPGYGATNPIGLAVVAAVLVFKAESMRRVVTFPGILKLVTVYNSEIP